MRSPFRPAAPPDPRMLDDHRALVRQIERRGLIKGGLTLGAVSLLSGCSLTNSLSLEGALRQIQDFNDGVQAALFDPTRLAPEYPAAMVLKPPRFNAYYKIEEVKPVDTAAWRLELGGLIADKRPWTLDAIEALPSREIIVRHVCVEGWDYIGQWSGVPFRTFLERVGADLTAKYVSFRTADDYPSSIDMASALHPQTLLATRYAGERITDPYGSPLRLRMAVKLGYKNPKWITAIEVTNTYTGGFWEKSGFSWFAGL